MRHVRVVSVALVVSAIVAAAAPVAAQAPYPTKAIEVIVPYAPGGGTDNLVRTIVAIIDEHRWSPRPINVVNKPGGAGTIGYNYLINKRGDPHVVAGATPTVVAGKIEGRLKHNHRDGMTMLMIVAVDPLMLSVRAESPFKTIEDFIKAAREKPGTLTVGGTSTNGEDHIFTYLIEKAANIKLKYVPFNSGGEVTAAVLGGHVDAGAMNPNEIEAQIEAKKARNLAVGTAKRLKDAPGLPTFKEKGYDVLWEQMRGMVGPADMGPDAVRWWQDTLRKVTETKRWQEDYIKRNLLAPVALTGEEANRYLDGLQGKYEKALTDLGAIKK